jgi:hypothetical protein
MLSPRLYRTFAVPYEQRIAACSRELGLPFALHICGKTNRILEDMLLAGADAFEIDYKTGARLAHGVFKDKVTFAGNIDPSGVLALGTRKLVPGTTRALIAIFAGTPRFILKTDARFRRTRPPGMFVRRWPAAPARRLEIRYGARGRSSALARPSDRRGSPAAGFAARCSKCFSRRNSHDATAIRVYNASKGDN